MKKIFFFSFLVFFTYGCNPIYNNPEKNFVITDKSNYGDLFEAFWKTISDNYPFDLEDWGKVYHDYMPKFRQLSTGLNSEGKGSLNLCSQGKAIGFFKEIIYDNIKDGHFVLKKVGLKDVNFNPVRGENSKNHDEFNENLLNDLSSLNFNEVNPSSNYSEREKFRNESNDPKEKPEYKKMEMVLYERNNKDKQIIYFGLNCFYLKQAYEKDLESSEILDNLFGKINSGKYLGLILDFRNNIGGTIDDIKFFISRFLNSPVTYARTRIKKGPLGYLPWADEVIFPHHESFNLKNLKIALLINGKTISLGETATAILYTAANKSNGYINLNIIGTKSFGAFSPVMGNVEQGHGYYTQFNMGGIYNLGGGNIFLSMQMGIAAIKIYNPESNSFEYLEGKGIRPYKEVIGNRNQLKGAIDFIEAN